MHEMPDVYVYTKMARVVTRRDRKVQNFSCHRTRDHVDFSRDSIYFSLDVELRLHELFKLTIVNYLKIEFFFFSLNFDARYYVQAFKLLTCRVVVSYRNIYAKYVITCN